MREEVLKKYPDAYCTWGYAMPLFLKKKVYRIEDGEGRAIASNQKSEYSAWSQAAKNIKLNNHEEIIDSLHGAG